MVSRPAQRGHPGEGPLAGGRRRGARRVFLRIVLAAVAALAILFLVVFQLLPALARRGDLNALVERSIRSVLTVPVSIGTVETDPLSEFSLTRVESLRAAAEDRFTFHSSRLTAFYRPLELLLERRVRELTATRPSLFFDLDRDLSGIIRAPEGGDDAGQPYRVDRFRVFEGRLALRWGGREVVLEELYLDESGMGSGGDVLFRAQARLWGARVLAEGQLLRLPAGAGTAAGVPRWRIEAARVEVEDLDLGEALAFLVPSPSSAHGRLSLAGSVSGVWPERVEARLSSDLRQAGGSPAENLLLDEGEARVELDAVSHGELDRVSFRLRLAAGARVTEEGQAVREGLDLLVRGEFEKRPDPGGGARVTLEEARLEVPGLGRAEARGSVDLSGAEPDLDVELRFPELPLRRIAEHPLGAALRPALSFLDGDLDISGRLRGAVSQPRLEPVEVRSEKLAVLAGGRRVPATLEARLERLAVGEGGLAAEGVRLAIRGVDLSAVAAAAGDRLESAQAGGMADAEVRLARVVLPPEGIDGVEGLEGEARLRIARGSFSRLSGPGKGGLSIEAPAFDLDAAATFSGHPRRGLRLDLDAALSAEELAVGPVVESLGNRKVSLKGTVSLKAAAGSWSSGLELVLDAPSLGAVSLAASARSAEDGPFLDLVLRAPRLETPRLLAAWLRDPLGESVPLLEGARFDGDASFEARLRGTPRALELSGVARARGLRAESPRILLEIASLEAPFRAFSQPAGAPGAPSDAAGHIDIARLRAGPLDLERVRVPFTLSGDAYRLDPGGIAVPLLGGSLEVRRLEVRPLAAEGERVRLSLAATGLEIPRLAPLLALPAVEGRASLEVRDLSATGERLVLDGRLLLDVFGGTVTLEGLSIDHPLEPYRVYSLASGVVEGLDLRRLGTELGFGVASGVLGGRVTDLVLTGSQVVGFQLELETVPRRGVAQWIDRSAIENLKRVLSGPLGAIEERVIRRFRYAGFGFQASLENGSFRLRGKRVRDGVEYLLYSRWWQFPRVEIINTRPGLAYDWEAIVENLRSVRSRSAAGSSEKEDGERP